MNELTNGAISIASTGIIVITIVISLMAWFFVNRASVRANQQIQLLESLLVEQKRQNQLLQRLTDSLIGENQSTEGSSSGANQDYTRLIPER